MRLNKWPTLMHEEFERVKNMPFEWGKHDCCLAAAGFIQAVTGIDHAADFRGKYDSALSAARVLGCTVEELADKKAAENSWKKMAPALAQRGDLVLMKTDMGNSLGICFGAKAYFAAKNGAVFHPMSKALAAWRIR